MDAMWGDLLFSALITAVSVFMYVEAAALPKGLFGTLGPGYFPKIVLGCLILASGTLTVRLAARAVLARRKESPASGGMIDLFARHRFVALIFCLFFLYVLGMKLTGFLPSTLVFMAVSMWVLAPEPKDRATARVIALTSILLTAGLYSVFTYAFSVMLPSGARF